MSKECIDKISKLEKNLGRLPRPDEIKSLLDINYEEASKLIKEYIQNKKKPKLKKFNLLVVLFLFISLVSFLLSLYFTGLWFNDYFIKPIAYGLSLTMVLYMVIAPQVFGKIKEADLFVKITFLLALIFSMGSTIAGQYNKATIQNNIKTNDTYIIDTYKANEQEIIKKIELLESEKEPHQKLLDQFSSDIELRTEKWGAYITEKEAVENLNIQIKEKENDLKNIREKIILEIQEGNKFQEREDFFSFIAKLTGNDRSIIELIISILPAIFLDLISPLSAYIATRLLKEKGLQ